MNVEIGIMSNKMDQFARFNILNPLHMDIEYTDNGLFWKSDAHSLQKPWKSPKFYPHFSLGMTPHKHFFDHKGKEDMEIVPPQKKIFSVNKWELQTILLFDRHKNVWISNCFYIHKIYIFQEKNQD